eukprot:m.20419 g.20419  ORF g.20419 m.20419 type:complete len:511 (+) comp8573_c0_seq3:33-1565(+)
MGVTQVLFETAVGYALFDIVEAEEIGQNVQTVQESILDLARFGKVVKLKAFQPFRTAEEALENINDISEGMVSDLLKNFLETQLESAKSKKKSKDALGVADFRIGQSIAETIGCKCDHTGVVPELIRGIRLHFTNLYPKLSSPGWGKAQLGLGHSYSRAKVKFNVHRVDNMIIQAISLLDQLDKDINTFSMRVKEWYGYHFPELAKIVSDNGMFARLAKLIGRRSTLTDESKDQIEEIVMDSAKAEQIIVAAKRSMGMEISDIDLLNVSTFAVRLIGLTTYRAHLATYLAEKMDNCAPNLAHLVGDLVGARLISHAGSLTNLAKYPASTVQILGAEKALFRALKTKGNTPKYGLLYNSSFIARAGAKNKGRISRFLANKCSIASRIDCFSDSTTAGAYGDEMKAQVEERLSFYDSGDAPRKNIDVMQKVLARVGEMNKGDDDVEMTEETPKKKKKEGKRSGDMDVDEDEPSPKKAPKSPKTPKSDKKKKKKDKKNKTPKSDKKKKKSKKE